MNNSNLYKNADVLQEIDDQHMDGQAGTVPEGWALGISDAFGNDGGYCTATVECQTNCNK